MKAAWGPWEPGGEQEEPVEEGGGQRWSLASREVVVVGLFWCAWWRVGWVQGAVVTWELVVPEGSMVPGGRRQRRRRHKRKLGK